MDNPKTENKIAKLTRKEKNALASLGENLVNEHKSVAERYKMMDHTYSSLANDLISALNKHDSKEVEDVKAKMLVVKDELDRLSKREKSLSEEIESINKAIKNDFDAKAGMWSTLGAWIIGGGTLILSGFGLVKSHKAFENGDMVDKGTRSLAEKMNALFSFFNFKRG